MRKGTGFSPYKNAIIIREQRTRTARSAFVISYPNKFVIPTDRREWRNLQLLFTSFHPEQLIFDIICEHH